MRTKNEWGRFWTAGMRIAMSLRPANVLWRGVNLGFALCLVILIGVKNLAFSSDVKAKLNSNDGSTAFEVRDSGDNVMGKIDSDGNALFQGSVTVRGGGGITSGVGNLDLRTPAEWAAIANSPTVSRSLVTYWFSN